MAEATYPADSLLGPPSSLNSSGSHAHATWRVTNRAVFRWRVYELGTRVRVASPPEFRQEIEAELLAIVEAAT